MKRTLLIAALAAFACNAFAGVNVLTSRPAGTDDLDWAQFGIPGTLVLSGSVGDTVGTPFKVRVSSDVTMTREDQGNGWGGNFTSGDALLWSTGSYMELLGEKTCTDMGANIQADFFGDFVARISAYDGLNSLLGSFALAGNSSPAGDGSAIFIGVHSDLGDIHRVVFSLDSSVVGPVDFAINHVTYNCCGAVPEPASMSALGLGALALLRKKRSK